MLTRRAIAAVLTCCLLAAVLAAGALAVSHGSEPATKRWPSWPWKTSCGNSAAFDPVAVFSRPATAELGSTPAERALRRFLRHPLIDWVPRHGYRLLHQGKREAQFVSSGLGSDRGNSPETLVFDHSARKGWHWVGSGPCLPQSLIGGHPAVGWDLAEPQRLGPGTTEIEVRLGPGECDGGRGQNDRAHPVFREIDGQLTLAIWLTPAPGGAQTCQALIEPPLKVKLPGPLGGRELFDSSSYPPHPARGPPRDY